MTTASVGDRFESARAVADAVLYEGYVLYPYRASSQKNQLRWQFGVLAPAKCCSPRGSDRSFSRIECLLVSEVNAVLHVRLRFLHVQHRLVEEIGVDGEFRHVDALTVEGNRFVEWDEAVERNIDIVPLQVPLGRPHFVHDFAFEKETEFEELRASGGLTAGRIIRRREALEGRARVTIEQVDVERSLYKVNVHVENTADWSGEGHSEIARHSFVGLHMMLAVDRGTFISLLEPPADCALAAAQCRSAGTYPVLIGDDDVVLSAPIILYDHPEVAPESPGDLYDATEIDEILALRVLTLTDDEKAEARGTDPRSAAIIDRCDDMSPEMWERLHGSMRSINDAGAASVGSEFDDSVAAIPWWDPIADASVDPWNDSVFLGGTEVRKGSTVVLHPSHRSDAQDLFLAGMQATVAGVFTDVDGATHVAITVDDDPANEELNWQGRYLFFHPDEIEPCASEATRS